MCFHELRHTSASILITKGINPKGVSQRLGHSTITQTLNTYTHLMKKSDDELLKDLEESSQNVLKNLKKH